MTTIYFKELSDKIIGACFTIHTKLGCSLPEHVYNRALVLELTRLGLDAEQQVTHKVYYNDQHVGHFFSDVIVDNKIILELKSTDRLTPHHESQLFTYLRITNLKVGYLINFGLKSVQFKRLVL